MITETVNVVIQCESLADYQAEKARIDKLTNLLATPQFHEDLLRITLDLTVER